MILPRDLPPEVRGGHETLVLDGDVDSRIAAALTATGGKVGQAAAMLGIHRTTIWRRLKQNVPQPHPPPKPV